MNSGTILNILLLMISGGCLYFILSLAFGKSHHKPKVRYGAASIWVKRSTPTTKVMVISMDSKTVEYYYTHVNGNKADSYKIYKDTLKNFQRIYRKQ